MSSYTIGDKVYKCSCKRFVKNVKIIQGGMGMAFCHGSNENYEDMIYCPWCGEELVVTDRELSDHEKEFKEFQKTPGYVATLKLCNDNAKEWLEQYKYGLVLIANEKVIGVYPDSQEAGEIMYGLRNKDKYDTFYYMALSGACKGSLCGPFKRRRHVDGMEDWEARAEMYYNAEKAKGNVNE